MPRRRRRRHLGPRLAARRPQPWLRCRRRSHVPCARRRRGRGLPLPPPPPSAEPRKPQRPPQPPLQSPPPTPASPASPPPPCPPPPRLRPPLPPPRPSFQAPLAEPLHRAARPWCQACGRTSPPCASGHRSTWQTPKPSSRARSGGAPRGRPPPPCRAARCVDPWPPTLQCLRGQSGPAPGHMCLHGWVPRRVCATLGSSTPPLR
mmetsp:Transcript_9946/g.24469  ORF Transcript_9946/g.24469 Transcript_9946/m.24469 type:complete len:205 (+) Transcript_9946:1358-1972(+)